MFVRPWPSPPHPVPVYALHSTVLIIVGIVGGLMGGIHGSMTTVKLGMPIMRPASLFAFYTFSCMTFRSANKYLRQRKEGFVDKGYDWKDTMVGVGWSTMMFGRALSGRPWIVVGPAALTTSLLVAGIEQALRISIPSLKALKISKEDLRIPSVFGTEKNWLQRRWERIAMMESRLHSLNQEIHSLNQEISQLTRNN